MPKLLPQKTFMNKISIRSDTFMISCPARTGSTLLTSYLQSHPQILCHGEIYAPEHVREILGTYNQLQQDNPDYGEALRNYRDNQPLAFLYKIALDRQARKVVGFKLKHDELVRPYMKQTRDLIQKDTDIKIIHLRRENLLERYLSWYIVNHVTGITMRVKGQSLPKIDQVKLDPNKCQENFEQTEKRYDFFKQIFINHPVLEVTYEELVSEQKRQKLSEIQDFLAVKHINLSSKLVKVIQKDVRKTIENYGELRDFFSNTKYSKFFK